MRSLAWFVVLAGVAAAACRHDKASTTTVASAAPPSAASAPSSEGSAAALPAPPGAPPSPSADIGPRLLLPAKNCRALEVKGRVADEAGRLLTTSAPLDRAAWLALDRGATLAIKNTVTGRELVFSGAGRVYPCVGGEEQFYLARGGVRTAAVAGARPGAEVLIATPHGVVRYGDARLDIEVASNAVVVHADVGDAWFESPSADGAGMSEEKVAAGARLERKGLTVDVKALVGTCETTAQAAEERARAVLKPGPSDRSAPLGKRAAEHMRARRAARFACAVAAAALGTIENVGDRESLVQALGRAEARYRGVPENPSDTEKSESR